MHATEEKTTSPYRCATCHATVFVEDGEVRRTCDHTTATIIAETTARLVGTSSLAAD